MKCVIPHVLCLKSVGLGFCFKTRSRFIEQIKHRCVTLKCECCCLVLMGLSSQPFSQIGVNVLCDADRPISHVYNVSLLRFNGV